MAYLTQSEFSRAIEILAEEMGLQRLRDKFFKLNGLVTRRKVASAASLASQLYQLSAGLRRQVPAAIAFQAIWAESIQEKVGEEGEAALEKLAERVNECLTDSDAIKEDKETDLCKALQEYETTLAARVGTEKARLDMIMKAVPAIAERLREGPPVTVAATAPAASPSAGGGQSVD